MKNLKIYSADEVKERLILRLVDIGHDGVALEVVDSDGENIGGGSLLSITVNGFLKLNGLINEDLNLPLDNKGRLKLVDYKEKAPVTFSDEEMRSIFDLRDKLRKDLRTATALQDHDDLSACLCVLEKMIEAFQFNQSIRLEPEAS